MTRPISNYGSPPVQNSASGGGTKDILVTLSSADASPAEKTEVLLSALGFKRDDVEAFDKKYGTNLREFLKNAMLPTLFAKDASDKPGFQGRIRLSAANYHLFTKFIADRRAQNALFKNTQAKSGEVKEKISAKNVFNTEDYKKAELSRLADKAQVERTRYGTPDKPDALKHFSVRVALDTKPSESDKILESLIAKTYGETIPFAKNRADILQIAKNSGVEIKNAKVTGGTAQFDLPLESRLKLRIAYNTVQSEINSADAARNRAINHNEISSFVRGLANGAMKSVKGTVGLLNLPETMKAIAQIIGHPVETFNALYKELGETWEEFKNAPSNKKSEMVGELVGSAIVEILLGKGIGKAGSILAKTKTGAEIIEKAKVIKLATTAKVAETFSDEAAALASQRAKQKLATQLYSGIPADVLANMAVFAGNKIKNGAVKFGEFSTKMVDEFGEKVRPKLLELYQESFEKVFGKRKDLTLDELLGGHTIKRHVGKSDNWLRNRLIDEPRTKSASTFYNEAIANRTIAKFVKENREAIENWLQSGEHRLQVDFEMNEPVGRVLTRGKGGSPNSKSIETKRVVIVAVRDKTPQGWHIETSFPIKSNGGFKF